MNTIRLSGASAQLRWHTYPAAAVERYTITRTAAGAVVVTGTVVLSDAFKLAQRPLLFAAPMLLGAPERRRCVVVTWPIDSFTLTEAGALTATLGATQRCDALQSLPRSDARHPITVSGG
jgi:hypothetical protein